MKSRLLTLSVLTGCFLIISVLALVKEKQTATWVDPASLVSDKNIILYYGETCPHCKIVEEYIAANELDAKIEMTKKEVYNNRINQSDLVNKARSCGMVGRSVGVPMLWDKTSGKCYSGDVEIIDYLKSK